MSKRKSTGGGSGSADAGAVKVADASMLDAIEQHLKKTMQQILSKRSGTKDEKAALQAMLETMRAGIMEATRAHTEVDDEGALCCCCFTAAEAVTIGPAPLHTTICTVLRVVQGSDVAVALLLRVTPLCLLPTLTLSHSLALSLALSLLPARCRC